LLLRVKTARDVLVQAGSPAAKNSGCTPSKRRRHHVVGARTVSWFQEGARFASSSVCVFPKLQHVVPGRGQHCVRDCVFDNRFETRVFFEPEVLEVLEGRREQRRAPDRGLVYRHESTIDNIMDTIILYVLGSSFILYSGLKGLSGLAKVCGSAPMLKPRIGDADNVEWWHDVCTRSCLEVVYCTWHARYRAKLIFSLVSDDPLILTCGIAGTVNLLMVTT